MVDKATGPRGELGRRHFLSGVAIVFARREAIAELVKFLLKLGVGSEFRIHRRSIGRVKIIQQIGKESFSHLPGVRDETEKVATREPRRLSTGLAVAG
jgi:hypothetical protein